MSASMEQGNQLLQAATDSNDNIRAENKVNFDNWQGKKKQDKEIGQGEDWFHGVTDVLGTHGAVASYYRQGKRAKELGLSYTGLAQKDISDAGSAIKKGVGDPIGSLKGAAQQVGDKAVDVGKSISDKAKSIKGTFFGTSEDEGVGPVEPTEGPVGSVSTVAPAPEEAPAEAPAPAADGTPPEEGTIAPAEEGTIAPAEAGIKDSGSISKDAGTLKGGIISKITGVAEGSLAHTGMSKALGNIGGGIDIVKDFEGLGSGDSFFSGGKKDATTGDKVSNALTVGGTVLDIASIALPFLEPVAAAVSVAGAIDGTYQSVKDQSASAATDKGNYQKNIQATKIAPSLSGTGFLASSQTDSHKLIGGSSSF